jgi:DNA/RNA endonuclease YhcR with UshA esterase domain
MTQTRIIAAAAGVLLLAAAVAPAVAHHSFAAEFDGNKPVTLKGTVTRMEWINPHSWIHLDVRNPDGTVTKWMIEGGTPNTLFRRGFTKDSLKIGTEIQVDGFRAKNGANRANGRDLILPDGSRLFLGSSGTGAPADGRDPTEK